MQYLASGTKREVYDLGNGCVLKIAKNEVGVASNRRELQLYRSSPAILQKYLAPVLSGNAEWLVMLKYERKMPLHPKYLAWLGIIERRFRDYGIEPKDLTFLGQPIMQNLRIDRQGRIILIDYGSFFELQL